MNQYDKNKVGEIFNSFKIDDEIRKILKRVDEKTENFIKSQKLKEEDLQLSKDDS